VLLTAHKATSVRGEHLMPDRRILIVPVELVRRIDDNRGDMSRTEFIEFLIKSHLEQRDRAQQETRWVTKEELRLFEEDVKQFLRSILSCFASYCLKESAGLPKTEKASPKTEFEELTAKLHELKAYL
jgi:hypothetical protein